jgi:hypothetical protein
VSNFSKVSLEPNPSIPNRSNSKGGNLLIDTTHRSSEALVPNSIDFSAAAGVASRPEMMREFDMPMTVQQSSRLQNLPLNRDSNKVKSIT